MNDFRTDFEQNGRDGLLSRLKSENASVLSEMKTVLTQKGGLEAMFFHADGLDDLLRQTAEVVCGIVFPKKSNTDEDPAIVAVGGYGRRELAPYSDVDLLFLLSDDQDERQKSIVEYIMYLLWDSGLKVGQAARTPAQCLIEAKKDFTVRTNLLESRLIWGDEERFADFETGYEMLRTETNGADFVTAKLDERRDRYARMGQSKYMLEPNVKEGRGGLRDLHILFWLSKYLFGVTDINELVTDGLLSAGACRAFLKAHRFLATIRCFLHFEQGKAGDVLSFDCQKKIAESMGYVGRSGQCAVERFMKHYYLTCKNVGELSRLMTVLITDSLNEYVSFKGLDDTPDFYLINDRLAFKDPDAIDDNPLLLLRAFAVKQKLGVAFNPQTFRLISEKSKSVRSLRGQKNATAVFFDILLSDKPDVVLRQMSESGVLSFFIPEWRNIVAQVQFDLYHVYTTDEHTLQTVGFLKETAESRQSARALYLAALLHDIGKGRGGKHEEIGAEIAEKITAKLAVDKQESETVVWLVRHHLFMSQTAFRRDIFDPKTIEDFVSVVQSPERLRLLYALTKADIKAVGPAVWNGFKEKLMADLFQISLEKMQGEGSRTRTLSPSQERLASLTHLKDYAFDIQNDPARAVTELTVLAPDHDGLFAEITGAMALCDVSVMEAKIATLDNGMALDSFLIQETDLLGEKKPVDSIRKINRLKETIKNAAAIDIESELKNKRKKLIAESLWSPPRVFLDDTASDSCTLIEINGTDAIGFLHAVTHAMTQMRLKIVSAHVYTYGSRVVDVFYVTNKNDEKLTDPREIEKIKNVLLDTINACTSFRH